jgi:hypothetical protein
MNEPFTLPPGFEHLKPDCERFLTEHRDYDRNVFIMTRFSPGDRMLAQLDESLRKTLCRHRLHGLRADDRMFASDDQIWSNVRIYMLCCRYGVAILEDRLKDEFNPNVALEYGFMRALAKPVLLLKDIGFRNVRADIVGTLHQPFDLFDIHGTLGPAIDRWVTDLGLEVSGGRSDLQQQALKAYRRLGNIECARLVRNEAQRKKEEDDECWYFGEEIKDYRQLLLLQPNAAHQVAVDEADRLIVHDHDFSALTEFLERFARLARG